MTPVHEGQGRQNEDAGRESRTVSACGPVGAGCQMREGTLSGMMAKADTSKCVGLHGYIHLSKLIKLVAYDGAFALCKLYLKFLRVMLW